VLCGALPTLPAQLQDARRYMDANDFDATIRTIREFAAAAGADPAAFTRLALLGFGLRSIARRPDRNAPSADAVFRVANAGPRRRQRHGGDAVVAFGFAPCWRASIATACAAHAGCRLVAVADTPAAPMVERADHLLLFAAAFSSRSGAVAIAQCLAECLAARLAATFALGGSAARRCLKDTEARLAAASRYVAHKGTPPWTHPIQDRIRELPLHATAQAGCCTVASTRRLPLPSVATAFGW
jgi:hypothetical protein